MSIRQITELIEDNREKTVIDIRKADDFNLEHYEGAINIEYSHVNEFTDRLPSDKPVYIFCYTGSVSAKIADSLNEKGIEAYSIREGYRSYIVYNVEKRISEADLEQETKDIERSIIKKFRNDIWRKFTRAINTYELISDGDKIAVCISGGKDSMIMAKLFQELYRHGKKNFELVFLLMNPGYSPVNLQIIKNNAKLLGIPLTIFESQIFDVVANIDETPCYLCARMRRGYLYDRAKALGCNKIALGHHYDDVIETILMGMLYGAQIQTMMPKLHSTNFEGMELIRPLYMIREKDIKHWRDYNGLHFLQCACKMTEDNENYYQSGSGSKRAKVKKIIADIAREDPDIEANIFKSVENVMLDTLIGYKKDGIRHNFLEEYSQKQ